MPSIDYFILKTLSAITFNRNENVPLFWGSPLCCLTQSHLIFLQLPNNHIILLIIYFHPFHPLSILHPKALVYTKH